MTKLQTVVFDTKPYDRESLQRAVSNGEIEWRFVDLRLSAETAAISQGARAICIFVNDRADRACLDRQENRRFGRGEYARRRQELRNPRRRLSVAAPSLTQWKACKDGYPTES